MHGCRASCSKALYKDQHWKLSAVLLAHSIAQHPQLIRTDKPTTSLDEKSLRAYGDARGGNVIGEVPCGQTVPV